MIITSLTGGLGNQMFQYAHALALSRRLGASLRLDFANYGRPFALGVFGLSLDARREESCAMIEYNGGHRDGVEWPTFEAACRSGEPTLRIAGYFQNENFFLSASEAVKAAFRLTPRLPVDATRRTPVCVHVRRGDFVGSASHGICLQPYYTTAIGLMRAMVPNPIFVVVSDDPGWCRTHLGGIPEVVVLPAQSEQAALETMYACSGFILSNSTFGWWAAWMADGSPVIAPDRFTANGAWEVCPRRWIRVPADGVLKPPATH